MQEMPLFIAQLCGLSLSKQIDALTSTDDYKNILNYLKPCLSPLPTAQCIYKMKGALGLKLDWQDQEVIVIKCPTLQK